MSTVMRRPRGGFALPSDTPSASGGPTPNSTMSRSSSLASPASSSSIASKAPSASISPSSSSTAVMPSSSGAPLSGARGPRRDALVMGRSTSSSSAPFSSAYTSAYDFSGAGARARRFICSLRGRASPTSPSATLPAVRGRIASNSRRSIARTPMVGSAVPCPAPSASATSAFSMADNSVSSPVNKITSEQSSGGASVPGALRTSPSKMLTPSKSMQTRFAPRYEWMRFLL
mmetsp:Transcript_18161/g.64368  ORF Transcript_18161/g.64368 Transcript_18161/m.64368 type:complete len:231 (+) Transcript_18161:1324-2016(+)